MPQKAAPTRTTRITLLAIAAGLALTTAGCSVPELAGMASMTPSVTTNSSKTTAPTATTTTAPAAEKITKTTAPTPSATTTPSTSAAPVPTEAPLPVSDLINGSLTKVLPVSDFELSTSYWSTLGMNEWTTSAVKPLTISASAQWHQKAKVSAYLSSMTYTVVDDKGNVITNGNDSATISPGYEITNPFTYNTVVNLPAVAADQRVLKVNLTYNLLVQTAPKSNSFYKQTVTDTLSLTLAKDAA